MLQVQWAPHGPYARPHPQTRTAPGGSPATGILSRPSQRHASRISVAPNLSGISRAEPLNAPGAITHGKGAHVWDLDGNEFIDCSMGLTSVCIGHGYEPVAQAVCEAAFQGTNFQRPAVIELEVGPQ